MVRAVEGIFRDGKVELREIPPGVQNARVIVTFLLPDAAVDLAANGIHPKQAADLRSRLKSMDEDWQRSEMDAYDAL